VDYLFATYGAGRALPLPYRLMTQLLPSPLRMLTLLLSRLFRPLPHMGMLRTPSDGTRVDADGFKPLEFWNVEGSPSCKIARETLCTLELPYVAHNVANLRGCCRLLDPNTGMAIDGLFAAFAIRAYLRREYAVGKVVNESMVDYTTAGMEGGHGTLPGGGGGSAKKLS